MQRKQTTWRSICLFQSGDQLCPSFVDNAYPDESLCIPSNCIPSDSSILNSKWIAPTLACADIFGTFASDATRATISGICFVPSCSFLLMLEFLTACCRDDVCDMKKIENNATKVAVSVGKPAGAIVGPVFSVPGGVVGLIGTLFFCNQIRKQEEQPIASNQPVEAPLRQTLA